MDDEMDLDFMTGLCFETTDDLVKKLRDEAVAATIEAQVRKEKYWRAFKVLSEQKLTAKFGRWEGKEGVIGYTDGEQRVRLVGFSRFRFSEKEPQIDYYKLLKSGKFSKVADHVSVSYLLSFFTPS